MLSTRYPTFPRSWVGPAIYVGFAAYLVYAGHAVFAFLMMLGLAAFLAVAGYIAIQVLKAKLAAVSVRYSSLEDVYEDLQQRYAGVNTGDPGFAAFHARPMSEEELMAMLAAMFAGAASAGFEDLFGGPPHFDFGGGRRGPRGFGGFGDFGGFGGLPRDPNKRDFYEVLGVELTAGDEDIKAAYRKRAKQCHPDLFPNDKEKEQQFKDLNEAHDVLKDPHKRAFYDRYGAPPPGL